MYGLDGIFLLKTVLLVAAFLIFMILIEIIMRKWFKLEKRNLFRSAAYVNETHRKIDWSIRGLGIAGMILGFIINSMRGFDDRLWYIEPWTILFLLVLTTETARAVMEKKHAHHPRQYISTISQILLIIMLCVSLYVTDFFGLL
ncbi:DUF4181 domain-containing protein [Cytobacillus gottheilii]|uniref:DUF4181 domain-containing protein n=1 Tax=Cytobacillus gottheilii TaxID=859144 RepID=UPI0008348EC8|nr:DUF4181 domain-containing protein [Cytobacillus gottheilii]